MGAFLTVVCGVGRFRRFGGRRRRFGKLICWGLLWLCLLAVYTAALALDVSRSGPLLFAAMTLAWVLTAAPPWKRKPETVAAGVAILLLLRDNVPY